MNLCHLFLYVERFSSLVAKDRLVTQMMLVAYLPRPKTLTHLSRDQQRHKSRVSVSLEDMKEIYARRCQLLVGLIIRSHIRDAIYIGRDFPLFQLLEV